MRPAVRIVRLVGHRVLKEVETWLYIPWRAVYLLDILPNLSRLEAEGISGIGQSLERVLGETERVLPQQPLAVQMRFDHGFWSPEMLTAALKSTTHVRFDWTPLGATAFPAVLSSMENLVELDIIEVRFLGELLSGSQAIAPIYLPELARLRIQYRHEDESPHPVLPYLCMILCPLRPPRLQTFDFQVGDDRPPPGFPPPHLMHALTSLAVPSAYFDRVMAASFTADPGRESDSCLQRVTHFTIHSSRSFGRRSLECISGAIESAQLPALARLHISQFSANILGGAYNQEYLREVLDELLAQCQKRDIDITVDVMIHSDHYFAGHDPNDNIKHYARLFTSFSFVSILDHRALMTPANHGGIQGAFSKPPPVTVWQRLASISISYNGACISRWQERLDPDHLRHFFLYGQFPVLSAINLKIIGGESGVIQSLAQAVDTGNFPALERCDLDDRYIDKTATYRKRKVQLCTRLDSRAVRHNLADEV